MKKFTTTIILASMLISLASCGLEENPSGGGGDTISNAEVTTASQSETSYTRETTPDSLPELDFKGAAVRIAYRGDETTGNMEIVGADTGDVVSDAVYNRNRKVEERLKVKFDFIAGQEATENFMKDIRTTLMSGDDAYDIIDAFQWRATPLAVEGYFKNLTDAPYLDYSKPWWTNSYMDDIQVSEDARYLLSGDISVWQLQCMSCMYFNKKLYQNAFGDPNELYQTVLDGKWTHELLAKYVKEAWQDLDGDGKASEGDIVGLASAISSPTDHFVYSAGIRFTERDKDGYPTLMKDQERNVKITETLYDLYYETPGVLIMPDSELGTGMVKLFTDGNSLFYPNRLYSTKNFREMDDEYGIIPFPKLDEDQEDYMALVHDSTTLFCIPVTVQDIEMPCAVLEAMCAENYRTVTPAYYDVALKVKYTRDDISSQIIDLIHDSVRTDFVYANNYCFTSATKLGTIERTLMGVGKTASKNYMSEYDSIKDAVAKDIENIIRHVR